MTTPASGLPPLSGWPLFLLTVFCALATFMEVLDITIANVSIPAISGSMAVATSQGSWVVSTYAVCTAIVMPLTGWLARRFGEARLFLVSVALFSVTSLLCGLSTSLPELLIFRGLQGLVSAPMVALSQSLILSAYPLSKRSVPMSLWGLTVITAPVLGPVIGGWITENYSWSWIFLINVPVGAAIVMICRPILRDRETPTRREPVDLVGLVLIVIGVGCLQLVLDRGHELDWFDSRFILVLAIIAGVALVAFMIWELGEHNPVINLGLFADYNFCIGSLLITMGYFASFCGVIIFPLWLQLAMGYPPLDAGLCIAAASATSLFLIPLVGKNANRFNPRLLLSLGLMLYGLSCLWIAFSYSRDMDTWHIVLPRFVQGVAMSMMFVPAAGIALATVSPAQMASASGLLNFLRTLGASASVAVSITVWDYRTTVHYASLAETWTGPDRALPGPAWGLDEMVQGDLAMQVMHVDAMTSATTDVFLLISGVFLVLAAVALLARPVPGSAVMMMDGH